MATPTLPDSLQAARDAAAALSGVDWSLLDGAGAAVALQELEHLQTLIDAAKVSVVHRLDVGVLARQGWASAADFITHVTGGRPGAGRSLLRFAERLAALEPVRVAHAAGGLTTDQARAITEQVAKLPKAAGFRDQVAERLVAAAPDAAEVEQTMKTIVSDLDPDGLHSATNARKESKERGAHMQRYLSFSKDRWGGIRIKGYACAEDVELIKATLIPLSAPVPSVPCDCRKKHRLPWEPNNTCGPQCPGDGRDRRDHGVRLWDALVMVCTNAQTLGLAPSTHGAKSEILDVGREQRLVTTAIWNALVARDKLCVFPGCTRPPLMCDAHHVKHWADGAVTSMDNMALLCGAQHRIVHNTGWELLIDPRTRRPIWIPPPVRTRAELETIGIRVHLATEPIRPIRTPLLV